MSNPLPSTFSAAALTDRLALRLPPALRDRGGAALEDWLDERRHGPVGTIVRDELAGLFDDCASDYNAGLLPLLLKLWGAPEVVDDETTLSRGHVVLERVGVSVFGATTPHSLRAHAAKGAHWHNGLFSRFALIAPHEPIREAFWPRGRPDLAAVPGGLVEALRRVYEAVLPLPSLRLFDEDGARPTNAYGQTVNAWRRDRARGVVQRDYEPREVVVEDDAWAAWERL